MSRSPDRERSRDRRMSLDSNHSRPEVEDPPAKRMRSDARVEDKARSKRLFGNLLGTLQKFKTEDKTSRTSEAAKRREQISERIASKIRSETNLHHDIAESERELKTLRIQTDSAEFIIKHKDVALAARHASLKPISRFLHTSLPPGHTPIFEGKLLNPSPIPLNQGPSREPPNPQQPKPLYFLPKILLPEQESELHSRIANIDELINEEAEEIVREKESVANTVKANRERIEVLVNRLGELRKQVKPIEKESRQRDGERERDRDRNRDRRESRKASEDRMEVEERNDEEGVQIRGDDGDVEVEY